LNCADKILICLFLLAIITWQALHQAKLFRDNKTISHFWKGVWYACAVVLVTIPYVYLFNWWYLLKIPILGVLCRLAFFDLILNKARGEVWWYNGSMTVTDIKVKGSWWDKLENELPIPVLKALKIDYIIFFIVYVIYLK
jgi:hypothetical protein